MIKWTKDNSRFNLMNQCYKKEIKIDPYGRNFDLRL